jgi:hypothetical protein
MRGKIIRGCIGLVFIMLLVGAGYFGVKLLISDVKGVKIEIKDNPTTEQQAIIDKEWEATEVINNEELANAKAVYNTLHEMANSKIISGDGKVWGVKSVTKQRVEAVKRAVADLKIEDAKINDMLSRWGNQDFTQAVDEHNYIWSYYLHGNVGRAVKLRK